jgi:hypothetical protein
MGLLDSGLKGNVMMGLAIGIGAAVLGPTVLPALAGVAKPLLKAAIKSGLMLYEKGKETAAELSEVVEDVVAEAKAEMEEVHAEAAPAAAAVAATVRTTKPRSHRKSVKPGAKGEAGA